MRFLLLTLLLGGLFSCGPERYAWNERATVTIETPGGLVTGTSVIEFRAAFCPEGCGLAGDIASQWDFTGEAVIFEVLPERYLIVLPETFLADAHRYAPGALGEFEDTGERYRNASRLTEPLVVPDTAYPRMLTFLEWGDRDSLREVDPLDMSDTFGDGVEFVSMTLEVTEDDMSEPRIDNLLRWTCQSTQPLRVPSDSPRGWYNVGGFSFGRRLELC